MFDRWFKKYKIVHRRDEQVVKIIAPNLDQGPWIAGGAVLAWVAKQAVKNHDIDVFVKDQDQFDAVVSNLRSHDFFLQHVSDNAISFQTNEYYQQKVQVIKRFFSSAEDLIKQFDFTICAIATDGNTCVKVSEFDYDFTNQILRLQNPIKPDSVKRIVKYMLYGYQPVDQLFDQVYSAELIHDFSDQDLYDIGQI